ncbi:MAG: glycosyltransferase family 4 protein [Opitutales bacterium]
MRVLLAHPGTQHSPRLARELEQRGLLSGYWTGLAWSEDSVTAAVIRGLPHWTAFRALAGRVLPGIPASRLHTLPANEIRALWRLKGGGDPLRVLHERNEIFQRRIPDSALRTSSAVIGFDTSSWLLAERAAALGSRFWLDRTIGHPAIGAAFLAALRRDYPAWAGPDRVRDPAVAQAEAREHELAHGIVVGSDFARATLRDAGVSSERIRVNPYGVDWERFANSPRPANHDGIRRFLFVGSLQGRKGLPYLLSAWERLGPVKAELWLAGAAGPDEARLLPVLPGLRLLGRIPHADIPALFARADVFVLPSLYEGFSLAVLEALAAGLPIIATPNTGAGEALQQRGLGDLIPAASVDALEAALRHHLAMPPDHNQLRRLSAPLAARFSWRAYGDRWAALLREP